MDVHHGTIFNTRISIDWICFCGATVTRKIGDFACINSAKIANALGDDVAGGHTRVNSGAFTNTFRDGISDGSAACCISSGTRVSFD